MEGRLRILFLKLALNTIALLGLSLANVVLAEEKAIPENYDIGIVFDGETKSVSEPSQVVVQKGQPQTPAKSVSKPIKAVPLEKNSTQVIQPAILRRKIDIDDIDTENSNKTADCGNNFFAM